MAVESQRFFVLSPLSPASERLREAEQFFLAGNLNEALAAAQQAWREHPHEADVYRVLAYLHMARGEFPPAVQAARQGMAIDGDNPMSHAMLAQVYLTFDIHKLAREVLTQASQRFPAELSFIALLADLCLRQRQYAQGVELAQQVLLRNPQDGYMQALLGQHFRTRRRYADAVPYLTHAVATYPQRADYQRDLGIALLHIGQDAAASRHLAQSMTMNPDDDTTKHYLFYALRNWPHASWYWRVSRFFFEYAGLGRLCLLIGWSAIIMGAIWLLVALQTAGASPGEISRPAGLIMVGIVLAVLSTSGVAMVSRRGVHFDAKIHQMLEKAPLQP